MSILALRDRVLSMLSRKLRERIPQFAPEGVDRDMIFFAYKDLITCLRVKWKERDSYLIPRKLNKHIYDKTGEFDVFLSFWIDLWLEKWRERVKILHKKPKIPKPSLERANRALRIYRSMHLKDPSRAPVL